MEFKNILSFFLILVFNYSIAHAQNCTYSTIGNKKSKGIQVLINYDCTWTKTERNDESEIQMFYKSYNDKFNTLNIQLLKIKENKIDFKKLVKNKNQLFQAITKLNLEVGEFQKLKIDKYDAYKTILYSDKINQSTKMLVIYIEKDDKLIEINYGVTSNNKENTDAIFNANFNNYLNSIQRVVIK